VVGEDLNDQNIPVREKKAIKPLGVLSERLRVFALMENKCAEVVRPFLNIENDGSVRLGVGSECAKGKMCSCACTMVPY
jgi:hypothetical protein